MKLGLHHQGEYAEPIRSELAQMVAAITTSYGVEHDAEGRQRVTCAKWTLIADLSLPTGTNTRVPVSRPDAKNVGDLTLVPGGIVRVRTPGVYHVLAEVQFFANAAGQRGIFLKHNGTTIAALLVATSGTTTYVQCAELLPCVAGDTLEAFAYQTSGVTLAVEGPAGFTFIRVVKVA